MARVLAADPYSGAAFVFRGKRGDYVKILTWGGSGLCRRQASGEGQVRLAADLSSTIDARKDEGNAVTGGDTEAGEEAAKAGIARGPMHGLTSVSGSEGGRDAVGVASRRPAQHGQNLRPCLGRKPAGGDGSPCHGNRIANGATRDGNVKRP